MRHWRLGYQLTHSPPPTTIFLPGLVFVCLLPHPHPVTAAVLRPWCGAWAPGGEGSGWGMSQVGGQGPRHLEGFCWHCEYPCAWGYVTLNSKKQAKKWQKQQKTTTTDQESSNGRKKKTCLPDILNKGLQFSFCTVLCKLRSWHWTGRTLNKVLMFFFLVWANTLTNTELVFIVVVFPIFGGGHAKEKNIQESINWPWLVWLSGLSAGLQTGWSPVWFPVRAHAWVVGQVPSWGHVMFLSLSFSLPWPLSKKKSK